MTMVKPYLWMTDFTPQTEWIDGKGALLWLAFFFSEIGAGVYMVSLFLGLWAGCLIGWLVCAILGGGFHMAYLGRPGRAWRSILRPGSSELSRGIILMGLFLGLGLFQLAPGIFSGLPWGGNTLFFKIILSILAFFVITHSFMTLSFMGAVSFWSSGIMPVLCLVSGLWVGAQFTTAMAMGTGNFSLIVTLEPVARWFFFAYVILTLFYIWNAGHGTMASQRSVQVLLKGELAPFFYGGVVGIASIIPLIITLYFCVNPVGSAPGLLWLRVLCALVGDLALRYCILKAARYMPLIHSNLLTGTHSV
jgi:formate-dependent nitrite reductase membrane component NrfD